MACDSHPLEPAKVLQLSESETQKECTGPRLSPRSGTRKIQPVNYREKLKIVQDTRRPIYVFTGEEDYLIGRAIELVQEGVSAAFKEVYFADKTFDPGEVVRNAGAMDLFGQKVLPVVKDANRIRKRDIMLGLLKAPWTAESPFVLCAESLKLPKEAKKIDALAVHFDRITDRELFDWLVFLYERWKGIDEEAVRTSAAIGCCELLLSGATTTSDHFYLFPKGHDDLFDAEVEGARCAGIRFHPCRGSMSLSKKDGGLPPDSVVQAEDEILRDCRRVIERYHDTMRFSMLRIAVHKQFLLGHLFQQGENLFVLGFRKELAHRGQFVFFFPCRA